MAHVFVQVEVSRQFGANNVEQWKGSCLVQSHNTLVCATPDHQTIAWAVANADANVFRQVMSLLVKQCYNHAPAAHVDKKENLSDEDFLHVVHQSDDGGDSSAMHLMEEALTHARVTRFDRSSEIGRCATGHIQKHPPVGNGISADSPFMVWWK